MPPTTNISPNIRKAAVLIRSVDAETAATLLAQLSAEEANEVRDAIRQLGAFDAEEQAEVAAEFRRAAPAASRSSAGVSLELSATASTAAGDGDVSLTDLRGGSRRFEFLEHAPCNALVKFLARERVQTIAVVLSYLSAERAAEVLTALPAPLQAEAVERLSRLGETDPESLTALERELSAWVEQRASGGRRGPRRSDGVLSILAAADAESRAAIMANLTQRNTSLAKQLATLLPSPPGRGEPLPAEPAKRCNTQADGLAAGAWHRTPQPGTRPPEPFAAQVAPLPRPAPRFAFDDLMLLTAAELAAVLYEVDAQVLGLALAGSRDELVSLVCAQMPRRTAKAFRRQLHRLGPTRLSDIEAAQQIVAAAAHGQLRRRRAAGAASPPLLQP